MGELEELDLSETEWREKELKNRLVGLEELPCGCKRNRYVLQLCANHAAVDPDMNTDEEAALSRAIVDAAMARRAHIDKTLRERSEDDPRTWAELASLTAFIDDATAALAAFRERGAKT